MTCNKAYITYAVQVQECIKKVVSLQDNSQMNLIINLTKELSCGIIDLKQKAL